MIHKQFFVLKLRKIIIMRKIYLLVFSLISTTTFSQQVLKRITQTTTELTVELFTFRNGSSNCDVLGNESFSYGNSERPHYTAYTTLYNPSNGYNLIKQMSSSVDLYNVTNLPPMQIANGNFNYTLDLARQFNGLFISDYGSPAIITLIFPINIVEISAQADLVEDSNGVADMLYAKFIVPKVMSDNTPIPNDFWLKFQSWNGVDLATGGTAQLAMQLWFKFNGTDWVLQNQRFSGTTYTIPNDICTSLGVSEFEQSNIKCYPNPTNDVVHISTQNETINQINVYDITGRLLKSQNGNNENEIISIQELPSAMYVLEVKTDKESRTTKIIKQ